MRDAPSGARAVSEDQAEEESDSEVSSAASLVMEPLREQTLAGLMEHWGAGQTCEDRGAGPRTAHCLPQTGKPAPPQSLPGIGFRRKLSFSPTSFPARLLIPPGGSSLLGKGNWRVVYTYNDRFVLKLADEAHGNEAKMARPPFDNGGGFVGRARV